MKNLTQPHNPIGRDGERAKILDVLPNTFIRSMWDEFNSFGCVYSYEYAKEAGWTFEEVEERWKPEHDEEYFCVDNVCKVQKTNYVLYSDEARWEVGNCFKTREEAEAKCIEIRKILKG